jgi:hypothetical protein
MGMATCDQGTLSQQHNYQLGLRNGWATIPMARHGVGMWGSTQTEGRTIQRQLPYGWMRAPPSNLQLDGVCTPHPGASTQAKIKWDMPNNPTPHRGRGELDDGYPLALIWQQTKMVLQN